MESNTPSSGLVQQVANAVADPENPIRLDEDGRLSTADVNRIIVAYDTFRLGAPVGTRMQNLETGDIAVRVDDPDRGAVWKVLSSAGDVYYDTQPSLPAAWVPL